LLIFHTQFSGKNVLPPKVDSSYACENRRYTLLIYRLGVVSLIYIHFCFFCLVNRFEVVYGNSDTHWRVAYMDNCKAAVTIGNASIGHVFTPRFHIPSFLRQCFKGTYIKQLFSKVRIVSMQCGTLTIFFIFWTWDRCPNSYQHCCSCSCWGSCCYQIFKVLKLFRFSNDRN